MYNSNIEKQTNKQNQLINLLKHKLRNIATFGCIIQISKKNENEENKKRNQK